MNSKLQSHVGGLLLVIAGVSITLATVSYGDFGPPPGPAPPGKCVGGGLYPDPAFCDTASLPCMTAGACVVLDSSGGCAPPTGCPGGFCLHMKLSGNVAGGQCNPAIPPLTCTKCSYKCCANGTHYVTAMDCMLGANAQCAAPYWRLDIC